ncbi:hypothetical protein [Microlunatus soli]|uniref:Tetratricopeptide repeat-containing protein n=1 Tax=Microlunatus soli TaxID=630515 RepID=A0A1H1X672_9ACTN|nr:hypothetical protein [Microlunatus soli]SDT04571.1 hypothetical protein SAMN04489812_3939 [Microlunatus soli]
MSRTISSDDITDLEDSGVDSAQIAATLLDWVAEDDVRYGVDVSPAELLSLAATHAGIAGDAEQHWELLERARAADGETAIDVEAKMIAALLYRGDKEAAMALADELRRAGVRSILSYSIVSDALSEHGEDRAALRWLNMGLRGFERIYGDDPDEDELELLDDLLLARIVLRRRMGLAPDSYDEEALAMNEEELIAELVAEPDSADNE